MDKREVSRVLNDIGVLLEIKGESFFKSKAYYDAARTVELLEESLEQLVEENRLKDLKGFGEALTQKISEMVTTGKLRYYDELKSSIPEGLVDMLKIQGLGPKKVKAIYENLGISSIGELKYACLENRLAKLQGFGQKTQEKVLESIENLGKYAAQFYYPHAERLCMEIIKYLKDSGLVIRCSEGGSLRRKKETVKDIDILASSNDSAGLMELFTSYPLAGQVTSKGDTKSGITLQDGINVDLRVVSDEEYPYALHHFTGSREHNTALRHLAKQEGMKVNEYGIFKGEELVRCDSEEEIFRLFNLQYIPPELRENNGEIEAARESKLPKLIEHSDIRGVLHVHSHYSDGADSIEELIKYCIGKGYSYLGISDHSQTAYYAGGLKKDDILRQHEEIEALNKKYPDFLILKGIELEILPDGSVDYEDDILSMFDFTIASVHSSFQMDMDRMTERVIKAISNKYVNILGHPTGRILLSREAFRINLEEVLKSAARNNVTVEINANPHRLDLDWRYCKTARELGCRFAICPDAHNLKGIDDVIYGINTARKGWLTADDVINTAGTGKIIKLIQKK